MVSLVNFSQFVNQSNLAKVVVADDDQSAVELLREAFERSSFSCELDAVFSGQQLLDYLRKDHAKDNERPSLILLDLNMPGKDGRQTLSEIKADPSLRDIPIIVMTSSELEEDIEKSYQSGVNAYLKKPSVFADLVKMTSAIKEFWFGCATLPHHPLT
ncbi:MAG TPA: response regulator [Candidatus Melainabacteria bacterium]|jgi:CheY-like chemotaxis protein|nr:response regulator [Candidatus Melainabacteria bacterium]